MAVSLTHRSLTRAVVSLFGPAIGWAVCLAAMPLSEPLVMAVTGTLGFAASLWLGRVLASMGFSASDVRLTLVEQSDEKLEIVSGS